MTEKKRKAVNVWGTPSEQSPNGAFNQAIEQARQSSLPASSVSDSAMPIAEESKQEQGHSEEPAPSTEESKPGSDVTEEPSHSDEVQRSPSRALHRKYPSDPGRFSEQEQVKQEQEQVKQEQEQEKVQREEQSVYLTPLTRQKLQVLAKREKREISQLVEDALTGYFDRSRYANFINQIEE